jgi:predicted transposase/invertase (TIGR01784 family)
MQLNFDEHYRPAHDVIFALTFADRSMFSRLCSAVFGEQITLSEGPHSQAVLREKHALLNSIRFDVAGIADSDRLFTLDIQRRYTKGRLERRAAYYVCRAISTQQVVKMRYEDLNPVHIAFILTEYAKDQSLRSPSPSASHLQSPSPHGVRSVGLCYLDTGELYDDLIHLTLVSVPGILKDKAAFSEDLYLFTRFFAIGSVGEAARFSREFAKHEVGKELIRMYNTFVSNPQDLYALENDPYFTGRLTEAQIAEERAYAAAKAEARGEQNRSIEIAKKLLEHHRPINEIIDVTGLSREEIEALR